MGVEILNSEGDDLAVKIANLQRDELRDFMRQHLRRRDLHKVVANLNDVVLRKGNPNSDAARTALKRLGFAE